MSDGDGNKFDLRILLACSGVVIAGLSIVATLAVKLYQVDENKIDIRENMITIKAEVHENRMSINQVKEQVGHIKTLYMRKRDNSEDE